MSAAVSAKKRDLCLNNIYLKEHLNLIAIYQSKMFTQTHNLWEKHFAQQSDSPFLPQFYCNFLSGEKSVTLGV